MSAKLHKHIHTDVIYKRINTDTHTFIQYTDKQPDFSTDPNRELTNTNQQTNNSAEQNHFKEFLSKSGTIIKELYAGYANTNDMKRSRWKKYYKENWTHM